MKSILTNSTPVVEILLCENNIHGHKTGKCHAIEFYADGESVLHLLHQNWMGAEIEAKEHHIIYYGIAIPHKGFTNWVGNMCWNKYDVPVEYALGFLQQLHKSKDWTVQEGLSAFIDKWNSFSPQFTAADLLIENYECEPAVLDPNQLELEL